MLDGGAGVLAGYSALGVRGDKVLLGTASLLGHGVCASATGVGRLP